VERRLTDVSHLNDRYWPRGDGRQDHAIISATDPKQNLRKSQN
jgi:hypothetical protein